MSSVCFIKIVPGRGLEPPRITPLAPKASASANFATPACFYCTLHSLSFPCAPSRDRTYDLILKRDLLYQLSYGRIHSNFYKSGTCKKYNRNIVN
jgi:hypothetical protein